MFRAALAYREGAYLLPKSDKKALEYFKKAAERGHPGAQVFMAMASMHHNEDHNEEAMSWLKKAAEHGEKQALYNIGISYHRGEVDGNVDTDKFLDLIRRSAEKGYVYACERLAMVYANGEDTTQKSPEKAKFWALMAYRSGGEKDPSLIRQLITQEDVVDGYIDSEKLLDDAVNAGEPHALFNKGSGLADTDIIKAVEYWQAAADRGSLIALNNLGLFYRQEKKDYNTANELFERAALKGIEEAQNALAESYYYGLGVEKDVSKAWYWNEKALNQGYTPARFLLALMGMRNELKDILPDKVCRATAYLDLAASDDYAPAIELLKTIHQK